MGAEARARVGLLSLLLVTFLAYYQLFKDGAWAGPTFLGMVLAVSLCACARRLGIGPGPTLLLSAAAYIVYLTTVFALPDSFYGVPTPETASHLWASFKSAYHHSAKDYAPVPVRTGYVVMVLTGLWSAGTIAEVATFRWKRPLLAMWPSIGLFAFAFVVGTGSMAPMFVLLYLCALLLYLGEEAASRFRSWGRAGSSGPAEGGSEGAGILARRMAAGCVVAGLFAPAVIPSFGGSLLAWRNQGSGKGSGSGDSVLIDPLVSIAPRIIKQTKTVLFTVETDRPSYWRLISLKRFDGTSWLPADLPDREVTSGRIPGERPRRAAASTSATFQVEHLAGRAMPGTFNPAEIFLTEDRGAVRANPETGDLTVDGGVQGARYTMKGMAPQPSYAQLARATTGNPGDDYLRYEALSPPVRELLTRWTAGKQIAVDRLIALQDHLRKFDYTLTADRIMPNQQASADYLTRFLTQTRAGYCQQFATAFALLARALGYPTRVEVGFLSGEPAGPGASGRTRYVVRGTDAHAWPEVFFEDYGWIRFEPTPRSDIPTDVPAYTRPPRDAAGNPQNPNGLQPGGVAGLNPRNLGPGVPQNIDRVSGGNGGGFGATLERQRRDPPAWQQAWVRVAAVLLALGALVLVCVPALKEWRVRRRYSRALDARTRTAAAFKHFEFEASEFLAPRRLSESAAAYARRISLDRRVAPGRALRLADLYEAAEYGPLDPGEDAVVEAQRLARSLRSEMWKGASWPARLLRLFSTRGLRFS
jgi:transglutaminase-like putative cysteine protease